MTAFRPTEAKAKALLEEADRLAAQGRFDEAAHTLLYRSIEDIEDRLPRSIRKAQTSREIAGLAACPWPCAQRSSRSRAPSSGAGSAD